MNSTTPYSLSTLSAPCPADDAFGGVGRLLICDAKGVGLRTTLPGRVELLPDPLPLRGVSLAEVEFNLESAFYSIKSQPTAQGRRFSVEIGFTVAKDRPEVTAWLEGLMLRPLFVVIQPAAGGLVRAFKPMRLTYDLASGAAYSDAHAYTFRLTPARQPLGMWYASVLSIPAPPSTGQGAFSSAFSAGFQ